jgi:hypothetical protein
MIRQPNLTAKKHRIRRPRNPRLLLIHQNRRLSTLLRFAHAPKSSSVLHEDSDDPPPSLLAGDAAAPERLKGKVCVVTSTQGSYQPLYHEFVDAKQIPKLHLFCIDGYSQSPYDAPAVNVDKYLGEKRILRNRKRTKDLLDAAEAVRICEICKCRIKTTPEEHRASARHRTKVDRLGWTVFNATAAAFVAEFGEL